MCFYTKVCFSTFCQMDWFIVINSLRLKDLCHTRPLGGTADKYRWFWSAESSWWEILRPDVVWGQRHESGRVCLLSGHTSNLKGPSYQALTLLGLSLRFIAWRQRRPFLEEYRRSPRHFWSCRSRLGYGPTPDPP